MYYMKHPKEGHNVVGKKAAAKKTPVKKAALVKRAATASTTTKTLSRGKCCCCCVDDQEDIDYEEDPSEGRQYSQEVGHEIRYEGWCEEDAGEGDDEHIHKEPEILTEGQQDGFARHGCGEDASGDDGSFGGCDSSYEGAEAGRAAGGAEGFPSMRWM